MTTTTKLLLLLAVATTSAAPVPEEAYKRVLGLSLRFYAAQRSGRLPDSQVPWRGDALVNDVTPAGTDITGGWFDAGDNVKFQLPGAWAASMLGWGLIQFPEGYRKAGQYAAALDTVRWGADFFVKSAFARDRLVGQVGNGAADHAAWERPENVAGPSPVYVLDPSRPGSDIAGNMAAALAQAAILFKSPDPALAARYLTTARQVFEFGSKHQGLSSDSIADAKAFYPSSNFRDDLAWGAVWLFRATGEQAYLSQAKQLMAEQVSRAGMPWKQVDWDNNVWTTALELSRLGVKEYAAMPAEFAKAWLTGTDGIRFTPKGLAWGAEWGALRHTGNAVFYMLSYARSGSAPPALREQIACFAKKQVAYILGEGTGQSFVVGFGPRSPTRPHHRGASCTRDMCGWAAMDAPGPNPNVIAGALVGGPDAQDGYTDSRNDYIKNEVAIDYNAGFTGALAALLSDGDGMRQRICE